MVSCLRFRGVSGYWFSGFCFVRVVVVVVKWMRMATGWCARLL